MKKKMPWWEKPSTVRPHYEDEQLRDEVRAVLSALAEDHPARESFARDRPTLEIHRLVDPATHPDQDRRLRQAYKDWETRLRSIDLNFMFHQPKN